MKPDFKIILFAVLAAASVCAGAAVMDGLDITRLQTIDCYDAPGYQEYEFLVTNPGDSPKQIFFKYSAPMERYLGDMGLGSISRGAVVPPKTSVRLKMFRPALSFVNQTGKIYVDGKEFDTNNAGLNIPNSSVYFSHHAARVNILVSQTVPGNSGVFYKGGKSSTATEYRQSNMPVESWSGNWLAYSGFNAVMITDKDLSRMPESVSSALDNYCGLGGTLIVVEGKVPESLGMPNAIMSTERLAFGERVRLYAEPAKMTESQWTQLFAHFRDTKFTADACDFSKLRDTFPVISERKNIAVSMFLLMLVFSFVIGPLNYFVLKRKNRLVWILWTTPAIALLFTGGVIFRAVFAEGLASRVRMMSVTELDEASQTASTVAAVGYYCPLLPRGGLMFDQQTEITFLDKHHRMMPDFDWTKGQNIHNWIQPRTQGYILARKTEQRRERLKISKFSDDEIEIMNGTGARILDLKVMGRNGKEFSCDVPIDPGYQTRIKASPKQEHKFANTDALRNLFKHIPAVQPGGYMLRLERSPFIDPGMKPGELKEDCLVFGKTANDGSGI